MEVAGLVAVELKPVDLLVAAMYLVVDVVVVEVVFAATVSPLLVAGGVPS